MFKSSKLVFQNMYFHLSVQGYGPGLFTAYIMPVYNPVQIFTAPVSMFFINLFKSNHTCYTLNEYRFT